MTYSFPQFKTEITGPIVSVDMTSVTDNTIDKLLTCSITLESSTAKMYGISLDSIIYDITWEDSDVYDLVMVRLQDFIV